MLRSEADRLTRVIVSTPVREYTNVENLKAHNILEPPDQKTAVQQHALIKETMQAFGAEVLDVPELEGHPNSVFTRDAALCTPEGYVYLRPGISTREKEGDWMAAVLEDIGEPCVGRITAPGSVDGGDVVLTSEVAFVGLSQRTNEEGIRQLSHILGQMAYETRTVILPSSVLHLDKVLMPVRPGQLLVSRNVVSDTSLKGFNCIDIEFSVSTTSNIICLGVGEIIVGSSNEGAILKLEKEGLKLHVLNISEFSKGDAGPNCLIMPLERKA
jgi:dimethylargininase